jgi:hypothetical protein
MSPDLTRNVGGEEYVKNLMRGVQTEPYAETINEYYEKAQAHQSPAKEERSEELGGLTDIECTLALPRVKDFDLLRKEWCTSYERLLRQVQHH